MSDGVAPTVCGSAATLDYQARLEYGATARVPLGCYAKKTDPRGL